MKTKNKYMRSMSAALIVAILALGSVVMESCTDKVDDADLYTFTNDMISDYLEERPDTFGDFYYVITRAHNDTVNLKGILSAYGTYTLFAPTNSAVRSYIDSLYKVGEIPSPNLEDITDSMAISMVYGHLINKVYLAEDLIDGTLPIPNMNYRFLSVSFDSTQNRQAINVRSVLLQTDNEVENGVIHMINQVIAPSNEQIPDLVINNPEFSIFAEALQLTGLDELTRKQEDEDYQHLGKVWYWNDNKTYYNDPDRKQYGYTFFMLDNKTLEENYNIKAIQGLIDFANNAYSEYTDNVMDDYKDRRNPLNRLISYHILPVRLNNLNPTTFRSTVGKGITTGEHIYEYYETMLPNTLLKVTMVDGRGYLRLNYYSKDESIHGATIKTASEVNYETEAINGLLYCIDKLLVYDRNVYDKVLNERLRFDAGALIPELSTNNLRFYGYQNEDGTTEYFCVSPGFSDYVVSGSDSRIMYLIPNMTWHNYMGDEFNIVGRYDLTITLPPVPEPLDRYLNNTYEIRIGFRGEDKRGIAQMYVDGLPTGTPVDMQVSSNDISRTLAGYVADGATDDNGVLNDKMMRNLGFMKAPNIMRSYQNADGTGSSSILRDDPRTLRKIVTTVPLSNDKRHTLRIKSVLDDESKQFHLDYIEIVPKSVYAPTTGAAEDRK